MSNKDDSGYVYIFANPSFPEWVKIGKSKDWRKRLRNCQTYAPDDWYAVATLKTSAMSQVETDMHTLIGGHEQSKKEFFNTNEVSAANDLRILASNRGELEGFTLFRNGIPAEGCDKDGFSEGIPLPKPLRETTFHAKQKNTSITMRVLGAERFAVMKGSALEPLKDSLANPKTAAAESVRDVRLSIERDPAKVKDGRLLCDIEFPSPSRALAVMLGYAAVQGPAYWVDDSGKPLADYL